MLQTPDEANKNTRIALLRQWLAENMLDGVFVPRTDAHQNETILPCDERVAWLSGFTGSAGVILVLKESAFFFVDGRYLTQVTQQVDLNIFKIFDLRDLFTSKWALKHLPQNVKIGYDPWLHTCEAIKKYASTFAQCDATLVPLSENPIDLLWQDRPMPAYAPVTDHPIAYSGVDTREKYEAVQENLRAQKVDGLFVSDLSNLAWLFNLRGADVEYSPLFFGYALVFAEERASLFLYRTDSNFPHDFDETAAVFPVSELETVISQTVKGKKIKIEKSQTSVKIADKIKKSGGLLTEGADPITLMKAKKNLTEQAGARFAHIRDGLAMIQFLSWFDAHAGYHKLTEIDAAITLEKIRNRIGAKSSSFETIAASNANAAMPHYHPTLEANAYISDGIFLIDSGGQYFDGTTDVTRTLAVGSTASPFLKDCYTRVLKGMISLSLTIFPQGTHGSQLDAFARLPLWQVGRDFLHGVGHGVGSYLNIHEGPQRISTTDYTPFEPGMIVSNEPGFYQAGSFGIRIENLLLVKPYPIADSKHDMLCFETLTLIPIDKRLINPLLMAPAEISWLDTYHRRVRDTLSPYLSGDNAQDVEEAANTLTWLIQATEPLETS